MIRNYLKTALRNLIRYKGFALINIASLTIGIVGCLLIGLFVWDEQQSMPQLLRRSRFLLKSCEIIANRMKSQNES